MVYLFTVKSSFVNSKCTDNYNINLLTASQCQDPLAQGMNTLLIVDCSASMTGEPLLQAKQAVSDFLRGEYV